MAEEFDFLKAIYHIRSLMQNEIGSNFQQAFKAELENEIKRTNEMEDRGSSVTEPANPGGRTPPRSGQHLKVSLCYHLWLREYPQAEPQLGSKPVVMEKLNRALTLVTLMQDLDIAITVIDKIEEDDPPQIEAEVATTEGTRTPTHSSVSSACLASPTREDLQNAFDNVFVVHSGILSVIPDDQREFLRQAVLSLATTPWVTFNVGGIHRALQQKVMFPMECQITATSSANVFDAISQFCCYYATEVGGLVSDGGMRYMKDWLHQQQMKFQKAVENCKAQLSKSPDLSNECYDLI
ncbi:hypothetical protein UCREL1_5405 [Eutypa lata UCREL1]|uniref:Uncharacterized protein n=1 Tax=Eutypa lata (strain UCR-EL1) TaxID=1287681 RepID=M7SSX6_EUTLA|nr:hypothetical protein UCREL1_5405 [Eutypa lata UCREL1]